MRLQEERSPGAERRRGTSEREMHQMDVEGDEERGEEVEGDESLERNFI